MGTERWGWALVAIGAALLVVSALADPIGVGDGDGIGWKQTIGMLVGVACLAVGLALQYARSRQRGASSVEI